MIHIKEAIVVEGKHDRVRLSSFLDAVIIETNGFRIFKDREKMEMLRKLAEARGLIILSDSDSAGMVIRNYLSGCIPNDRVRHIYIPPIQGKERRKSTPSKEGLLGVEGLSKDMLIELFKKAGVVTSESTPPDTTAPPVTLPELYALGLLGHENSAQRRREILHELSLPPNLSAKRLLEYGNTVLTPEKFRTILYKKD